MAVAAAGKYRREESEWNSFVQIGLPSSYLNTLGKDYFSMVYLENGKTSPGRLLVSRGVVSCEPL